MPSLLDFFAFTRQSLARLYFSLLTFVSSKFSVQFELKYSHLRHDWCLLVILVVSQIQASGHGDELWNLPEWRPLVSWPSA